MDLIANVEGFRNASRALIISASFLTVLIGTGADIQSLNVVGIQTIKFAYPSFLWFMATAAMVYYLWRYIQYWKIDEKSRYVNAITHDAFVFYTRNNEGVDSLAEPLRVELPEGLALEVVLRLRNSYRHNAAGSIEWLHFDDFGEGFGENPPDCTIREMKFGYEHGRVFKNYVFTVSAKLQQRKSNEFLPIDCRFELSTFAMMWVRLSKPAFFTYRIAIIYVTALFVLAPLWRFCIGPAIG